MPTIIPLLVLFVISAAAVHAQDVVWAATYTDSASGFAASPLPGGGYLVVGHRIRQVNPRRHWGLIVRLAEDGTKLSETLLDVPSSMRLETLLPRGDSGFFAIGRPDDPDDNLRPRGALIVRLDTAGEFISIDRVADTVSSFAPIRATSDGGFVIAGARPIPPFGSFHTSEILKYDSRAELEWHRSLTVPNDLGPWAIRQLADGGYALLANPPSGPGAAFVVTRLDANGDSLWRRQIDVDRDSYAVDLIEGSDGRLVLPVGIPGGVRVYWLASDSWNIDTVTHLPGTITPAFIERVSGGFLVGGAFGASGNAGELNRIDDSGAIRWSLSTMSVWGSNSDILGFSALRDGRIVLTGARSDRMTAALISEPVTSVGWLRTFPNLLDLF